MTEHFCMCAQVGAMCHIGHTFNGHASTGKTIQQRQWAQVLGPACRAVSPW